MKISTKLWVNTNRQREYSRKKKHIHEIDVHCSVGHSMLFGHVNISITVREQQSLDWHYNSNYTIFEKCRKKTRNSDWNAFQPNNSTLLFVQFVVVALAKCACTIYRFRVMKFILNFIINVILDSLQWDQMSLINSHDSRMRVCMSE